MSWVEHIGTEYKPSLAVVLDVKQDSSQPVFSLIREILYISNQCHLAVGLLQVVDYNPHFHAYEISTQSDTMLCSFEDLHDYHPLVFNQCAPSQQKKYVDIFRFDPPTCESKLHTPTSLSCSNQW